MQGDLRETVALPEDLAEEPYDIEDDDDYGLAPDELFNRDDDASPPHCCPDVRQLCPACSFMLWMPSTLVHAQVCFPEGHRSSSCSVQPCVTPGV